MLGIKTQAQRLLAIAAGTLMASTLGIGQARAEGGVSLYGESAHANQTGQGYIIFEEQGDRLIGAFYYPQSEYSCFTGRKQGQTLEILSLPNFQEPMANFTLSLDQMEAVNDIGASEKQTLSACRQDVIVFLNQQQTAMEQPIPKVLNRQVLNQR